MTLRKLGAKAKFYSNMTVEEENRVDGILAREDRLLGEEIDNNHDVLSGETVFGDATETYGTALFTSKGILLEETRGYFPDVSHLERLISLDM